jgi:hypothetical protein
VAESQINCAPACYPNSAFNQGSQTVVFPNISPAELRVDEARRIVARQRELIAKLKTCNGYYPHEEELLSNFERSLAIFEDDLAVMSQPIDGATAPPLRAIKAGAF